MKSSAFFCACRNQSSAAVTAVNLIVCLQSFLKYLIVRQKELSSVGLHPLVCSLIAKSHSLQEIVCFSWTTTVDITDKMERRTVTVKVWYAYFILPDKTVFTFHMCREWGVASLSLLGGGGGWRSSRPPVTHHWDRKMKTFQQKNK